jgi:sugar-specific transcriptional regulator TrmB
VKLGLSYEVGEASRKVLRELGLTMYESSVYLSLVQRGVMTASEVSDSARVPFSKVYEVLNNLEQKGWVNVEKGRPSRYFAKSPVEAFEAARNQLEGQIRGWEKTVVSELEPLYEQREVQEKPDIWILRGEASVVAKIQEMLRTARTQVMIAIPPFAEKLAGKAVPLLATLSAVDAQVLVMVAGDVKGWNLHSSLGSVEVRQRDSLFGGGVIVDGVEALLLLGEESRPSLVVWSNHVGLVKFAKDYFQHLWNSSTKNQ